MSREDQYTHPSMIYYEQIKAERLRALDRYVDQSLRQGVVDNLSYLEEMKARGYFASVELCGDKDYWVDTGRMYRDLAAAHMRAVQQWVDVLPRASAEDQVRIEDEIRRLENFAIAALRKAGVVTQTKWVPKRKEIATIKRMIREMESEGASNTTAPSQHDD